MARPPLPAVALLLITLGAAGVRAGCKNSVDTEVSGGPLLQHYRAMQAKMLEVTPDAVEDAVAAAQKKHRVRKAELTELVRRASAWGDIRSFNHVFSYLDQHNKFLFASRDMATVSDVLAYVLVKNRGFDGDDDEKYFGGMFDEDPWSYSLEGALLRLKEVPRGKGMLVLVDHIIARRIKLGDEGLRGELRKILEIDCGAHGLEPGCVEVAALEGWMGGIHAFNQLDFVSLVDDLAARYAAFRLAGKMGPDAAVGATLAGPVDGLLDEIFKGGGQKPKVRYISYISHPSGASPEAESFEAISAALRPQYPSFVEFRDRIVTAAGGCPDVSTLPAILDREAKYFSMNKLATLSRRIHAKVTKYAQSPKHPEKEEPFYLIDEMDKSYILATHVYLTANPATDPRRVKYVADAELRSQWLASDPPFSLVLDDYAGSGQSLVDVADQITDGSEESLRRVVVAPLLQSFVAENAFLDSGITSLYGELLYGLTGRMDSDSSAVPQLWMGSPGFRLGFFFITLPYMSPDNNCAFFARHIAPMFVMSQNGVKDRGTYGPLCTPEARFEAVMRSAHINYRHRGGAVPVSCKSFVLQYYCKTTLTAMESGLKGCPMVGGIGPLAEDLQASDSEWAEGYGVPGGGMSAACVREAIDDRTVFSDQEMVRGERGAFSLRECDRICESIDADADSILQKQIRSNVNDAGLFGWTPPQVASDRLESENPCERDARFCGADSLLDLLKNEVSLFKRDFTPREGGMSPKCVWMALQYYCKRGAAGGGGCPYYIPANEAAQNLRAGSWDTTVGTAAIAGLDGACVETGLAQLAKFSLPGLVRTMRRTDRSKTVYHLSPSTCNMVCGLFGGGNMLGRNRFKQELDSMSVSQIPYIFGWTPARPGRDPSGE